MYRKQISQKTSPSLRSTPKSQDILPSQSYGSLSSVVQRVQQDPNSVSGDERQQLESAIGTRSTREILAGKQTPWVPEFQGISQQLGAPIQAKRMDDVGISEAQPENKTGLPDHLKAGIENLSGMAMDDVSVHYNSSQPSELQALAYTQGTDIHVAPGQETHLPHEAWHVVQQKQGRVKPSIQIKGINANVDFMLETEADQMGEKANNIANVESRLPSTSQVKQSSKELGQSTQALQRSVSGTPVRQFACGGSSRTQGTGTAAGLVQNDQAMMGIADTGEIIDVEVARNFVNRRFGDRIVQTEIRRTQVYHISDTNYEFYTATSNAAADSILETGLDPNFGGTREPDSITGWNSRGHVYFSLNASTANGYGKMAIKPTFTLLKFTLPLNHPVTIDPELGLNGNSTALRTNRLIPASLIQRA